MKLICINNKGYKGRGYFKDMELSLTIGKEYYFNIEDLFRSGIDINSNSLYEPNKRGNFVMIDDDGERIQICVFCNFFKPINEIRDEKLNKLLND